ncbi:hypothetical protein HY484_04175 [Candidatus Woesearchaeota archaeon]|nr:hypothetical protein [Candidatus Woesearchaeota archaeon]
MLKKTLCAIVLALNGCGDDKHYHVYPPAEKQNTTAEKTFPNKQTLDFTTKEGLQYTFDVQCFRNGVVVMQQNMMDGPLRFYETGPVTNNWGVEPGDYFVVTDTQNSYTHILKYVSIDDKRRIIDFEDLATGSLTTTYSRNTREGQITIGALIFGFNVEDDTPYRLAIDQNADGLFDGTQAKIVKDNDSTISQETLTQ